MLILETLGAKVEKAFFQNVSRNEFPGVIKTKDEA